MGLHALSLGSAAQGTVQEEEAWRAWQMADLLEAEGEEPMTSAEVRWGEMWGGLDSCCLPTSCLPWGVWAGRPGIGGALVSGPLPSMGAEGNGAWVVKFVFHLPIPCFCHKYFSSLFQMVTLGNCCSSKTDL